MLSVVGFIVFLMSGEPMMVADKYKTMKDCRADMARAIEVAKEIGAEVITAGCYGPKDVEV